MLSVKVKHLCKFNLFNFQLSKCTLFIKRNNKELSKSFYSTLNEKRDISTITTIDCNFMGIPEYFASYLIKEGNSAAFIDTNTNNSLDYLLQALDENKLTTDQVKYIIVTHKHLDSSGGLSPPLFLIVYSH